MERVGFWLVAPAVGLAAGGGRAAALGLALAPGALGRAPALPLSLALPLALALGLSPRGALGRLELGVLARALVESPCRDRLGGY